MKIKYLGQTRHYKPEYQLGDFIRVNGIEDYDVGKVLKIMARLYVLFLEENYPGYFNSYSIIDENIQE